VDFARNSLQFDARDDLLVVFVLVIVQVVREGERKEKNEEKK